jgi:hypothetical protein
MFGEFQVSVVLTLEEAVGLARQLAFDGNKVTIDPILASRIEPLAKEEEEELTAAQFNEKFGRKT